MNFCYEEKIKKLSKASQDKFYRANVYRRLNKDVGEAWRVEIQTKDGKCYHGWITDIPDYLNRTHFFKQSKWDNGVFQITDHLGKTALSVCMNETLPTLQGVLSVQRNLHMEKQVLQFD